MSNNVNLYKLAGILDSGSAGQILTSDGAGNFSFATLEIPPSGLDSASAIALQTPQDFAYSSLTGTPNVLDSSNVSTLITTAVDALVAGAPGALDTLNELATALNDDSNAIAAITSTLALKLNIADVIAQDFAYTSLTGTPSLFDGNYSSLAGTPNILDSANVIALQTPQDFAYSSLTGAPNVLDSANVIALQTPQTPQDFAYSSLTGTPNVLDSSNVSSLITTAVDALVAGAPAALDTLNELATALNDDSNAIAAITNTLTLKLNIADVVAQDFAYTSLTGTPNILDSADVIALSPPQDFAYSSLTGTPNIDSDYVASRVTLAYAGSASVSDTKFIADSAQTIFTGLSYNDQFVQVHLNGVLLVDSDDYVKSGNDTITTTTPLNLGDQLVVSDFTSFFTNQTVDSAYITGLMANTASSSLTSYAFVADSGATTFGGMAYSPNNIQVFLNGILLGSTDYTATNGTTIVLESAVSQDDEIRVASFNGLYTVDIAGFVDSAYINARVDALPQDFAYASLTGTPNILDSADVIALSPQQDFAYTSLTGTPNILDSADVIALSPPQDFAYASLTGTPNITGIVDSAINALVDGAPGALDTLNELATALNDDSNAIAAITSTLALKLNTADVVAQDFAYASLTGTPSLFDGNYSSLAGAPNILDSANVIALQTPQDFAFASLTGTPSFFDGNYASLANLPNILDSAAVIALSPPQDFAYASLTGAPILFDGNYSSLAGTPNVLDSADVVAIASALGGVDSAAIISIIDSNYVASRVTLAYAGGASVQDYNFIADSGQTIFTGLSFNDQFVQVHLNGVLLLNTDDYSLSGGNTVTLLQALEAGDQLVVSDFTSFFTNQLVDSAYIDNLVSAELSSLGLGSSDISTFKFIATASQTVFTGSDANSNTLNIDASGIQVFLNGILLQQTDDYTATSSTITLTEAALENSHLIVQSFKRYFNLTGIDSANIIALQTPQDFAYASLTGTPTQIDLSSISEDILPTTDNTHSLGSPTKMWKDIYVGPGSLYVNGQKVLEENAGTITFTADSDQSLAIRTYGTGVLTLQSNTTVNVAGTLQMAAGKAITSADGLAVLFGDKIDANQNQIINLGTPTAAGHAVTKTYVDTAISNVSVDSAEILAIVDTVGYVTQTEIDSAIDALVGGAPAALDTLNELATQLNSDSNAIAAITNTLALKLNIADVANVIDSGYVATRVTDNLININWTPRWIGALLHPGSTFTPPIDTWTQTNAFTVVATDTSPNSALTSTPGVFTIPAGVTKVRMRASTSSDASTSGQYIARITLNGLAWRTTMSETESTGGDWADTYTAVYDVVEGDVIALQVYHDVSRTTDTADYSNWFEIEVLEGSILTASVASTVSLNMLLDVDSNLAPTDGQVLIWNNTNSTWVAQDFAYGSLTGTPNVLDSADVIALSPPQDFAYASLTGTPNILDSAAVTSIASALGGGGGGVDSAAITSMIDSDYIASRAALTFAGNASVTDTKLIASAGQTVFTGLSFNDQFVQVHLNGVLLLDTDDYVKSGNDTITTTRALEAGDQLVVSDFTSLFTNTPQSLIGSLALSLSSASVTDTKFIADSDQTIFTGLSFNNQFVQVHLNGVLLVDSDDYTKSGNDTITTTYLLNAGDQLVVSDFTSFFTNTTVTAATINGLIDSALSNVGSASITDTKFIADSAQTIFTGLSFNDQLIQVHLNGVLLIDSDDYVKSGNDTITTTYPLNAGDYLVVSDFTAFFTSPALAAAPATSIAIGTRTTAINISITNQQFTVASRTGTVSVGVS